MQALLERLSTLHGPGAYALFFVLVFGCGIGLPLNEDLLIIAAAVLVYYGALSAPLVIVLAIFGVVLGDALALYAGARLGDGLARRRWLSRIVPPERLSRAQEQFRRRGHGLLFIARFLPGVRTAVFFAAGTLGIPLRALWLYDGVAALIEIPALVYGVRYAAGNTDALLEILRRFQLVLVAAVLVGVFFYWMYRRRRG